MRIRLHGLIAALCLALAGCAALPGDFRPLEVGLADLELIEGGLFQQRVLLTLNVRNPNNFEIALEGLRFDLDINGMRFARGLSNHHVTVPRLSEAKVPASATVTLVDLVNQMLVLGQRQAIEYSVTGDAFVTQLGGQAVPFEFSGTLRLLAAPAAAGSGGHRRFVPRI